MPHLFCSRLWGGGGRARRWSGFAAPGLLSKLTETGPRMCVEKATPPKGAGGVVNRHSQLVGTGPLRHEEAAPCCRSVPSGGLVHGVHRRDPRALRSAFHERRSGARGRSLWTPVDKPASLAFVLSDRDGADVNRHAKWTRIGIHEGPLSWRVRNDRAESGRCAGQSRPKPRGGTIAWSSVRSRSQIASNASAAALSCRFSGRASSQAAY